MVDVTTRNDIIEYGQKFFPSDSSDEDGDDIHNKIDEGFAEVNNYPEIGSDRSNDEEEEGITHSIQRISEPHDRYNFNYLVFYLLGITTLLPWNFFLIAEEYWMYKFRNVSSNATDPPLTPLQTGFISDLSATASISGTLFLILNAIYGHKISLNLRVVGSTVIIVLMFIINTAFVEINTDQWQETFFVIILVIVVLVNSFAAILTGSTFGIVGLFPSEYMTAIVSGQALGGIFATLTMIITLTFGASPKMTAFIYFLIGIFMLLICLLMYALMTRTKHFQFYTFDGSTKKRESLTGSQEILTGGNHNDDNGIILEPDLKIVCRKIYLYAVAECLVFTISLAVYPAITVLIHSEHHGSGHAWDDLYFTPVVNYLTFNSGDYLGRILAGLFLWPNNRPHLLLILTVIRAGFIPVLMMTNTVVHNFLPIVIHTDATLIVLIAAFGLTNGYLANMPLILAPKVVMHHEKEMASSIMAACLSIGLMFGSSLSLVLVRLL